MPKGLRCPLANCKNRLFYGDNLDILRDRIQADSVDLCYIDPPFNSKRSYNQIYNNVGKEDQAQERAFIDTWTWDERAREGYAEIISNAGTRYTTQTIELLRGLHHVLRDGSLLAYLVSMARRITEIQRALKPTGSFYLHCDPTSSHYLKLVIDGIFCPRGGEFQNEIIWKRTSSHNDPRKYGNIHDNLFFYTKSSKYKWNTQYTKYSEEYVAAEFRPDNSGRMVKYENLTAPSHGRDAGRFEWRGTKPPTSRMWRYKLDRLEELLAAGLIKTNAQGKPIMRGLKTFLDDLPGVPLQSIWTDVLRVGNTSRERLGYPTQKPIDLLERIILSSSDPGDLVLDAFCGCGTTIDAAELHGRNWIGMDITYQSIALVLKRLEDRYGKAVANAVVLDGVPKDMASAEALAHKRDDRVRKEFEKWAVLTYTMNRAAVNYTKGADRGIDGTAYFWKTKDDTDKAVFQVKSGNVTRGDIAKLKGDMEREQAAVGTLITLEDPTSPMRAEAKQAGTYVHPFTGRSHDRVQIVTIRDVIEKDRRIDLPLTAEVLTTAHRAEGEQTAQTDFMLQSGPRQARKKSKMVKATLPLGFKETVVRKKPKRRA